MHGMRENWRYHPPNTSDSVWSKVFEFGAHCYIICHHGDGYHLPSAHRGQGLPATCTESLSPQLTEDTVKTHSAPVCLRSWAREWLSLSIFWPPDAKSCLTGNDPDSGKDWGREEKRTAEDEMVGWYHWLSGHESEQTQGDSEGQGSLVWCEELDTTEWLNNNSTITGK